MGLETGHRRTPQLALLAMLLLTACGVGSREYPPFVEGVIGTGGGTIETQQVRLVLPPGALTQDTVVGILPQPTPLPIDPLAGPIEYMPGLMCIGPVGHDLAIPARVRVCYDPLAIPVGSTEADLVLLEWDAAAGFMRVSATAIQDFVTHCFTDNLYVQLGHIGVGVRTGPPPGPPFTFVFPGGPLAPVLPVAPQGGVQQPQLHLADTLGATVPTPMPGSIESQLHIPSRAADRVMFALFDNPTESTFLHSSDVEGGGERSLLGVDDEFRYGDRFIGWLENDTALFVESSRFDGEQFYDVLRVVGGDGTPAPADLSELPLGFFLTDLRISPDGSLILVRLEEIFSKGGYEIIQVYDAVTGVLVSGSNPGLPFNSFSPLPRWLPDSTGIYWVEQEINAVRAVDADGANVRTIFTMPAPIAFDFLIDFVLSPTTWTGGTPATQRGAYVRRNVGQVAAAGVLGGPGDYLTISHLDGTGFTETALSEPVSVNELIYHPNGALVFGDFLPTLRFIRIIDANIEPWPGQTVQVFDGATAALRRSFTTTLADLDVSRADGSVLLWMQGALQDPVLDQQGLYAFPADMTTFTLLSLDAIVPTGPARFLSSWRRCPGTDSSSVR